MRRSPRLRRPGRCGSAFDHPNGDVPVRAYRNGDWVNQVLHKVVREAGLAYPVPPNPPLRSEQRSIHELIERSSLGSPDAVAARQAADPEAVKRVMDRAREIEQEPDEQPELLTENEHEALSHLGRAANSIRLMLGDGPLADNDWSEAAADIHRLQHMVMAQAAARAYPDRYRLGGFFGAWSDHESDVADGKELK